MTRQTHLSKNQINQFLNLLKDEHKSITEWIAEKREEMHETTFETGDSVDLASEYENSLKTKRELERKQVRLRKIEARLRSFEEFGYCTDCGIEIELKRLNIDPAFDLCMDCSEIRAIKSRNHSKIF